MDLLAQRRVSLVYSPLVAIFPLPETHTSSDHQVHTKTILLNMAQEELQIQVRLHLLKILPHLRSAPTPILHLSHNR